MLANSVSHNFDSQDDHGKTQTPHGNIIVKLTREVSPTVSSDLPQKPNTVNAK